MVSTNIIKNATLSGVRVLCIEDLIALPWGTMYLADLGADVIRAESHTRLRARAWGPFPNGVADPEKWWNHTGVHLMSGYPSLALHIEPGLIAGFIKLSIGFT